MSKAIWIQNMDAIKKRYSNYADVLNADITDAKITVGVQEVCEKKVLYAQLDDVVIQLDSLYDSGQFLSLWFQTFKQWNLNSKVLLFGLGNGMYVRKLLHELSPDHQVIVFEPSVIVLQTVFKEFDMTDLLENEQVNLLLYDAMDREIQEYYYDLMTFADIETFAYSNYLNYNLLFRDVYYQYMEAVQNTCTAINSTQSVIGRYGEIYNLNTFSNFKYFLESRSLVSLYVNMPKDVPAVIVAAGPSLDKNIKKLHEAKGKAFIIAVDSALRPLLREGIIPDLCVSMDGKKMFSHFSEKGSESVPLVCCLQSHNKILSNHTAIKFFMNDLNQHVQHFLSEKRKILPAASTGGSVANEAFSIARMLGITTIILVGQDLAFTDQKTHASTTVRGEWKTDVSKLQHEVVEGIDGTLLQTSGEFILYKIWFEEQIRKDKELTVIDATEGGAKIKGSRIMSLEQAIRDHTSGEYDFKKVFEQTTDFFTPEEKKEMLVYFRELPDKMEDNINQIKKAKACYEKMLTLIYKEKYHTGEFTGLFKMASKIGEDLEKEASMEYVRNQIQEKTTEVLRDIFKTESDERKELISACKKGLDYLSEMEAAALKIILMYRQQTTDI